MRLLLLGCSQKKHPRRGTMPAFLRYEGPAYRVFRKFLREHSAEGLDLFILSAAHGLISGDLLIADYDNRLTQERAAQLKPYIREGLTQILARERYDEIFIGMGKDYRELIADLIPSDQPVTFAEGGIGEKSSALYQWLRRA